MFEAEINATCAAEIVIAYVSYNSLPAADLPGFVEGVVGAISKARAVETAVSASRTPPMSAGSEPQADQEQQEAQA